MSLNTRQPSPPAPPPLAPLFEWMDATAAGGETVIIKRSTSLARDHLALEQVRQDWTALTNLRHPALPRYRECRIDGQSVELTFEKVPGENLRARVQHTGGLRRWEWLALARNLSAALAALHHAEVVHGAVSSDNVRFDRGRAWLVDLAVTTPDTEAGLIEVEARYLSPELLRGGGLDKQSDLYALGVVLLEALGAPPAAELVPELLFQLGTTYGVEVLTFVIDLIRGSFPSIDAIATALEDLEDTGEVALQPDAVDWKRLEAFEQLAESLQPLMLEPTAAMMGRQFASDVTEQWVRDTRAALDAIEVRMPAYAEEWSVEQLRERLGHFTPRIHPTESELRRAATTLASGWLELLRRQPGVLDDDLLPPDLDQELLDAMLERLDLSVEELRRTLHLLRPQLPPELPLPGVTLMLRDQRAHATATDDADLPRDTTDDVDIWTALESLRTQELEVAEQRRVAAAAAQQLASHAG